MLHCYQSSRFDELPDVFDLSGKPGSFDDVDPQTTNLYVGNLSPQVRFCFDLLCYQLLGLRKWKANYLFCF